MSETRQQENSPRRRRPGRRRYGNPSRRRRPQESGYSLVFLFPGQGSQHSGMGRQMAQAYPVAAETFAQADAILGFPLSQLCFEGPEPELRRTANAQPALLTCSVAILRVLHEKGLKPSVLAGHSLGEFAAWVAAGVLDFADAVALVKKRGELMEHAAKNQPGGMLAVLGIEPKRLKRLISGVKEGVLAAANFNCPGQIVVSGEESALRKLRELVLQEEGRAIPLRVSGAFHSPLMETSAKLFRQELRSLRIKPAHTPVICNVNARQVRSPEAIKEAISAQMTGAVQWEDTIVKMAQGGAKTFLEVGPGEVLCGLVKRILGDTQVLPVGEPDLLEEALTQLKAKQDNPEEISEESAAPQPPTPQE